MYEYDRMPGVLLVLCLFFAATVLVGGKTGARSLAGLLVAGVVVASLGAVMDVAMSLSSALWEVHAANPSMGRKELWRAGMNVGRDMVGTMTNTLILAFLGSGFVLVLYIYTIAPDAHQLLSSAFLATELVSGISSSIGVILSVPLTAAICSGAYGRGAR